MQSDVVAEFRTTCVPGLVEMRDIYEIGLCLQGAPLWVLQQFVPQHAMVKEMQQLEPHSSERIRDFVKVAQEYVDEVQIRGL